MSNSADLLDFEGRGLPFSNEAEQSVLGSILIDPSSINQVMDILRPEHFYIPQNRKIYEILCNMSTTQNITIDFITVLEQVKANKVYEANAGKEYLTTLVQSVPSSANIILYANIIRERFYVRSLILASRDIISLAQEGELDADKMLDSAEQRIYDIRQGKTTSDLVKLGNVLETETITRLTKIANPDTRAEFKGIPTGISALDDCISGLNKADLIILGARPGMGKTSFALNIARHVALKEKRKVAFFSLEMTRDQLAQRLLSTEALVSSHKFRTGELEPDEWTRIAQAAETYSGAEIYLDETSGITVPEMKAKLRRMKDVDLVIIDYLGLMQSARRTENRVQEISDITRNLKIMAKDLSVPVIACAQLSRGTEGKGANHKPALADLRDSGSIEQDADIVLFLYREGYYKNEKNDPTQVDDHKSECIVAKNRHGEARTIELFWDAKYTRFTS